MSEELRIDSLLDEDSFFSFVARNQKYNTAGGKPPQSSAAIAGTPQYLVNSHSLADILQGTTIDSNPEDMLLVLNKTLTDQLRGLADDGVHSFGSLSTMQPELQVRGEGGRGGSGSSNGSAGALGGGLVDVNWVRSLPTTHENGAIIWRGEGKGSREMHLGTSDDIHEDIAQHQQYEDMPQEWLHPWNMDRIGGPRGGENDYYRTWAPDRPTIMVGELHLTAGASGAFGYLEPEEERWYVSMGWPYGGAGERAFGEIGRQDLARASVNLRKEDYRGRRILVYNVDNQKAVVGTPGDWGPHPYHTVGDGYDSIDGFIIGLSPDIHHYFGTEHGTNVMVRFMPDDTPLGPYALHEAPNYAQSTPGSAVGSQNPHTSEAIMYAGEMIMNHPNNYAARGGGDYPENFRRTLTGGFAAQHHTSLDIVPTWDRSLNKGFFFPSLLNYLWVILEAGFRLGNYQGSYYHRLVEGTNRLSYHSYGGAIDFGALGYNAGPYTPRDSARWQAAHEQLYEFLATLPSESHPREVISDFGFEVEGFRAIGRPGKNHLHIGFNPNQVGRLMRPLMRRTPDQTGGGSNVPI